MRAKMPEWKIKHPGAENLTLAVMGCVVNGPGESRHANIGISLPGTGEAPAAPVFIDGEKSVTLRGDNIAREFVAIIDGYVERRYGQPTSKPEPGRARKPLKEEARFGAAFLRKYGWRLMLLFVGLVLPLWGFAELADELREGEPFEFDEPILQFAHGLANAGFDRVFLLFSALGYQWGVVPFDIVLVLALALNGARARACSQGWRWRARRC